MRAPPRVLYAGAGLSGRGTSLAQLVAPNALTGHAWPRVATERLATGIDVTLSRGPERVEIALLDARNCWFESIAAQAASDVPGARESAQRVLSWAPTFTGVVFVVDSQDVRLEANLETIESVAAAVDLERVRVVFQLNKRDAPRALSIESLRRALARPSATYVESIATTGLGVRAALEAALRPSASAVAVESRARVTRASPRALFSERNWPMRPVVADRTIVESLRVRSSVHTSPIGEHVAIAAIWPKRILAHGPARPGRWTIDLAERCLVPGGAMVIGARMRLPGAEPRTCELLRASGVWAYRVLVGDARAVRAAEQLELPSDAYVAAATEGLGRAWVEGELFILGIQDERWVWVCRDASDAIVELGACDSAAAAMLGFADYSPGVLPLWPTRRRDREVARRRFGRAIQYATIVNRSASDLVRSACPDLPPQAYRCAQVGRRPRSRYRANRMARGLATVIAATSRRPSRRRPHP